MSPSRSEHEAPDDRHRMVAEQLRRRGIRDPDVLEAMARVPRERFVPPALAGYAYGDEPLPIGGGQTISQPFVVALMAESLDLLPGDRVLEIGTGSGYAAAVLSHLAAEVYTIERHADLAETARARLGALGYQRVFVRCGDGTLGWPERGPFDGIVVAAASPRVPPALLDQLAVGGRLVIPVGSRGEQSLVRIIRTDSGFRTQNLGAVRFVPLVGEQGWGGDEDGHPLP